MLAGVCLLRNNLTTGWSLRPIGESLETLEKARSKTDGEVPALKRITKEMP